jgi:uncharacterized membrane-anchored protein
MRMEMGAIVAMMIVVGVAIAASADDQQNIMNTRVKVHTGGAVATSDQGACSGTPALTNFGNAKVAVTAGALHICTPAEPETERRISDLERQVRELLDRK